MPQKLLYIIHGSETYTVNEQGHIARPAIGMKASGSWLFVGFTFHHWTRTRIDAPLAAIFANPAILKGRTLWGHDIDYGTRRSWGSPRTIRAWVE